MRERKTLKNYVNGEWIEPKSNETQPVYNPATGDVIAYVPISKNEDVDQAVKLADKAYQEWKEVPVPKRARLMFKLQNLLVDHWDELSELITVENGKNLKESRGEVLRRIGSVVFSAAAPAFLLDASYPSVEPGLDLGY